MDTGITAIILVGGKGKRMRPFDEPKCLVPVNGKAMLGHIINGLKPHVSDFIFCVGYRKHSVIDWLKRWSCLSMKRFDTVNSGEEASITKRIIDALMFSKDKVMICYGDEMADVDIPKLLEEHKKSGAKGTITVHPLRSEFGIVHVDTFGDAIQGFEEKPILPFWINIGYMVFDKSAFDGVKKEQEFQDVLNSMAIDKKLTAFRHIGKRATVNTIKDLEEAERVLA